LDQKLIYIKVDLALLDKKEAGILNLGGIESIQDILKGSLDQTFVAFNVYGFEAIQNIPYHQSNLVSTVLEIVLTEFHNL
jgi:hypothetical protein